MAECQITHVESGLRLSLDSPSQLFIYLLSSLLVTIQEFIQEGLDGLPSKLS
jgi:hypothetical protein